MGEVLLINLFIDMFLSAFGSIYVVAGIFAFFLLSVFLLAGNFKVMYAVLFASSPFIVAATSSILDIQWTLSLFILLAGFLLAISFRQMFLR
jgi:hypothetical protein